MMKRSLVSATSLALVAMVGCTGDMGDGANFSDVDGTGAGAGAGVGSAGPSGSTASGGPTGGTFGAGSGGGSTGEPEDNTCAASAYEAKPIPLDMFIMLDKSGSMNEPAGLGTRWNQVGTALKSFVRDPAAAGIGVGLGYFPIVTPPVQSFGGCVPGCTNCTCINAQCTCNSGLSCNANEYAIPDIPILQLPLAADSIVRSIDTHFPDGDTPTGPALAGAIQHAQASAFLNPDHKTVVVLATDGEPTSCSPLDVGGIAQLAAFAANSQPQILTFVIGVGNIFGLNQIAVAGGTQRAFVVDGFTNVSQAFLTALQEIRQAALACEYEIPQPTNGEQPNYNQVNVQFTPTGRQPEVITQVPDALSCDPLWGGWYYDNPAAPNKILICPRACDRMKVDTTARIEILLGCDTVVQPPR